MPEDLIIEEDVTIEEDNSRFEMIAGIIIAVFTAFLAISGLIGGSYGDSILLDNTEKASAYDWYYSKSIKQILTEEQKEIMTGLLEANAISADKKAEFEAQIGKLDTKIEKYNKEKNEILQGSDNIDSSQWVQDVDGELGKVVGAKDWEAEIKILEKAGSKTDMSDLFLEICLVMGAISLVMQSPRYKKYFLILTVCLGVLGVFFIGWGLLIYWPF